MKVECKMRKVIKKLLFLTYLPIITIILLEIGVRTYGSSEHYIYDPVYMPFNGNADIPFIHKPNLKNVRGRGLSIFNTDSLGLRFKISGAQYGPKNINEYRIAITGDSVTFGEGIRKTEDTFPQVLEDLLNKKQNNINVKVFNYGVSAYSVKHMAATLSSRMLEIEPDLVLMAIIPDDFDLSHRSAVVDKYGFTMYPKITRFWSKDSNLKRYLRKIRLVYLLSDIRCRYQTKPNKHNILQEKLPESYEFIKQFKDISDKQNLSYSIVLLPMIDDKFGGLILEQFQKDKIAYIDLTSLSNEFSLNQFIASKFDGHPSVMVHKRIGETLAEYIFKEYLCNYKKWN